MSRNQPFLDRPTQGALVSTAPPAGDEEASESARFTCGQAGSVTPVAHHPLILARFWSRVDVGSDFQCWEWEGARNPSGYGRFAGSMAHRFAYELVQGPIPKGAIIRHRCDNPPCCNPRHLLPGTTQDNAHDARKSSERCVKPSGRGSNERD